MIASFSPSGKKNLTLSFIVLKYQNLRTWNLHQFYITLRSIKDNKFFFTTISSNSYGIIKSILRRLYNLNPSWIAPSSNTYLHWSWLFHSQPRAHLAPLWSLLSMKCIILGVLEIWHVVNFKAGFLSFSVTPWCVKPMPAWGCGRKFARLHILDFDGEQVWG